VETDRLRTPEDIYKSPYCLWPKVTMPPTFILNTLSELSRLRFPTPITRRTHIAVYLRSLSLYLGSHTRSAPDRWHVLIYACQSRSSSIFHQETTHMSFPHRKYRAYHPHNQSRPDLSASTSRRSDSAKHTVSQHRFHT
jgi:hypothetical protein